MHAWDATELPDEWRALGVGTRGAHARFGTFRRLTGYNMPDIFEFTHWRGSGTSGDNGAATGEVAGTGWSIAEFIKGIIFALRKHISDYEGHKLQQADLESQHTTHAAATLDSFTQVRGILDYLRDDNLALRAELVAMRSETVNGATLAAHDQAIVAVQAEQQRLQRIIWDQAAELATVAQQTGRMEESLRHYQLGFSGRLDEAATSYLNLQNECRGELLDVNAKILGDSATTLLLSREIEELKETVPGLQRQLDAQVAEQHVLATFATDSVEEDFADRLATVETAAVRLQEAAARDQHEHGRVVTRVEQESARTLQVIRRVTDLESGSLAALWRLARLERGDPDPTD